MPFARHDVMISGMIHALQAICRHLEGIFDMFSCNLLDNDGAMCKNSMTQSSTRWFDSGSMPKKYIDISLNLYDVDLKYIYIYIACAHVF